MAYRALPPGTVVRRRTVFGLFDADGWAWATIKATFWFLLIIFLLGYLPDRAYYFTVSPTLDVGYNAISPINLCSGENRGLPCPAPAGAVVPWEVNPNELALPQPRSSTAAFGAAENIYVVGGRTPDGQVTPSVLGSVVSEDGNLTAWAESAPLDEPRADGTLIVSSGVPYYIGGVGPDGNPVTTVYRGVLTEGALSGWELFEAAELPVAITDASAVATVRGIYLFGGRIDGAPSDRVFVSEFGGAGGELGSWTELTELRLPEPRADATAVQLARFVYVLGGEGPDGITNSVFFLALDEDGAPVVDEETELPQGWGVSVGQAEQFALPEPRARHMSFVNSGAMYVIGGVGADGELVETAYWASPTTDRGTIPLWRELDVTDLPQPRADAGMAVVGAHAFVIGGETPDGAADSVLRAVTAPALPFFRLGLFGLTIPALSIQGEIGQQLGYIAAGSVGAGMLILLIIIGIAYSHQRQTLVLVERVSRGRFRAPRDDEGAY